MILKIFSVYDSKTEAYAKPFFLHSKGEAIRGFTDAIQDHENMLSKHPADFTLFEIGEYDDATGLIFSHNCNINLGSALEHKKQEPNISWKSKTDALKLEA